MSKEKNISQFQNQFKTQESFRRNRYYYDILKLNEIEHNHQLKRRRPLKLKEDHITDKIQVSFQSAKKDLSSKVDEHIDKFKFRLSFCNNVESTKETETSRYNQNQESPRSSGQKNPKKIKGVSMQKVISRQKLDKLKASPCSDERLFNNFYITQHDLSKTPGIGNYSNRNGDIELKHITDLNYNSQKKYEQVYFDNRTTSCIFNLKIQKDNKGRYFFNKRRPENDPSTDLNPEGVAKSFSVANPYKKGKIMHFYKLNGRQLPSQLDQRYLSPNSNFYKDKDGHLIPTKIDFSSRKYKDQLLSRDLEEIKKSKRPYFNRDQICDFRYFKQQNA